MKILEFKNVVAKYKNAANNQLNNISFDVNKGEMVALVGSSGAGKSTIFAAIYRDLKILKGQILIQGTPIYKANKKQTKKIFKNIGYLSQSFETTENDDVLTYISRIFWFSFLTKHKTEQIFNVLKKLNIEDIAFNKIKDISGGQLQRVEIAKMLLKEKSIILADEPTSNLDPKTTQDFLNILKEINEQKQITIVCVMHDIQAVKKNFQKYIAIKNGEIFKMGACLDLNDETIDEIYR
ncbi:ATP-binding cassette domain-containing protein [[Mycoplasma] gypis]|uniref:ATP-binding cassette domain-containing protein n=1 Tax=[Mycoplasma] gypis TaxID=92404 RepID=A0ABZ2RNK5_9BACT|nr:ATP-binding cassette domain-containing protein [[Mycoplasma] gypis]MBN0919533.1 ATP-binding cassette domain-containing protein [[Mycoplasma] gypis]